MGLDVTGAGAIATAVDDIIGKFFPDKTKTEQAQISAALSMLQAQTDINKAEAQSTDPLQHWRGGMGWVCVLGYFHNFIFQPLFTDLMQIIGKGQIILPQLCSAFTDLDYDLSPGVIVTITELLRAP